VSTAASPRLRWITAALLLIAAGITQLLRLTSAEGKRVISSRLSALLCFVGGISLLAFPIQSTLSLTLFLGFLLAIEGVMELAAAAAGGGPARWLVLADGIVTAVLGGLLITEWPLSGTWAIGTMFGIGLALSALNLLTAPTPVETTQA